MLFKDKAKLGFLFLPIVVLAALVIYFIGCMFLAHPALTSGIFCFMLTVGWLGVLVRHIFDKRKHRQESIYQVKERIKTGNTVWYSYKEVFGEKKCKKK